MTTSSDGVRLKSVTHPTSAAKSRRKRLKKSSLLIYDIEIREDADRPKLAPPKGTSE